VVDRNSEREIFPFERTGHLLVTWYSPVPPWRYLKIRDVTKKCFYYETSRHAMYSLTMRRAVICATKQDEWVINMLQYPE
jgi:hypothetical protein